MDDRRARLTRRSLVAGGLAALAGAVSGARAAAARAPFVPVLPFPLRTTPSADDPPYATTTTSTTSTTSTTTTTTTTTTVPPTTTTTTTTTPATASTFPPAVTTTRGVVGSVGIGTSVQGRQIAMYPSTVAGSTLRLLVISAIHGDERATAPLARRIMDVPLPDHIDLYVVPVANPDGWAADSRFNANGVDLNRQYPWRWASYDGGPAPFSEPESQALRRLVKELQPHLTVWIHQPLGYVATVGTTDRAYADAWRGPAGLPFRADLDQHGGGETWTNKGLGLPSMLVEIDTMEVRPDAIEAHAAGFAGLLTVLHA